MFPEPGYYIATQYCATIVQPLCAAVAGPRRPASVPRLPPLLRLLGTQLAAPVVHENHLRRAATLLEQEKLLSVRRDTESALALPIGIHLTEPAATLVLG